jgi:hypothetical protein
MLAHTAKEAQVGSQTHKEPPISSSRDKDAALPSGGSKTPSRRRDCHALEPRMEEWPGLLEEFDVQFLMLDTDHDCELFALFRAHPGWAIDSQDDRSVLLVRSDVSQSPLSSTNRSY